MDDTILSLGDLRLSAHLATPPPPGRAQGLVVCHGFPNGPRGAATVGTTYADLADRLARDSGFVVLTFNFRGTGTSEGDFSVRGWLDDLRAAVRMLAARDDVRGVWTVGFGHGATFALCEAMNDDLVRGVASIAARTSLGDWVRDPGGLVAEAREMGMITTDGYPTDMGAWGRELQLLDAEVAVRRLGDRPLLVLHGVDDIDVPVDEARAVAQVAGPVINASYSNWGGTRYTRTVSAFPPASAESYGGPNTSDLATVGYDRHSFVWPQWGSTDWLTQCYRAKVYFMIDQYMPKSAKLKSAKMHIKQVGVKRLNDTHASCAVGYTTLTALWTNWANPPVTNPLGLDFGSTNYLVDVTTTVKKWLDGTQVNYGFLLTSEEVDWGKETKMCGSTLEVSLFLQFQD